MTQEIKELAENETPISRDDLDIEVYAGEEDGENVVWVKFTNFEDDEEAEEYAVILAETLPLLLFESTRLQ